MNNKRGKGRPKVIMTDEIKEIIIRWKNGEYEKTVLAIADSKLSRSTFYRFSNILESEVKK